MRRDCEKALTAGFLDLVGDGQLDAIFVQHHQDFRTIVGLFSTQIFLHVNLVRILEITLNDQINH